jgi:uncharacterized membrane protein
MMDGRYGEHFGQHDGLPWGILVVIAAIAALVVITVLVVRALDRSRAGAGPAIGASGDASEEAGAAEAILRTRLANGDIDVAEYRERMSALAETS